MCLSDMVTCMVNKERCCKVDAVVTMDSKGQLVLPKDLREKAMLKPNDKLAIIGCESDGEVCCIIMIKAERLGNTIKDLLGPMFKEIFE
jgi:antitoxin PrlF